MMLCLSFPGLLRCLVFMCYVRTNPKENWSSLLMNFCRLFRRYYHRLYVPRCETPKEEIGAIIETLENFILSSRRLFVLTGAGISTESGIRDYRSAGVGLYAVSEDRPIDYTDFLRSAVKRRWYWARNYVGWEEFSSMQPNRGHFALAGLEKLGKIHWLVTQNVDALHTKAGSHRVTELHGCAHGVVCLGCRQLSSRHKLQERMKQLNPKWDATSDGQAPDGDTFLTDEQVKNFIVPTCENCTGILKPQVVFFGDSVPKETVSFVYGRLNECDAVLIVGSSVEVYSAFRFVHAAWQQGKSIAILNIGSTRADKLASMKLSAIAGDILPKLNILSELDHQQL